MHPLGAQLTISHCRLLFKLKDNDEIGYYINQSIQKKLSKRDLEIIIKNNEYSRLPAETRNKLITKEKLEVKDIIPNPIIIKNKENIQIVSEKILHQKVESKI